MANVRKNDYISGGIHDHVWTFFIATGSIILAVYGLITASLSLAALNNGNTTIVNPFIFEELFLSKSTVEYIFVLEIMLKSFLLLVVSTLLIYANRALKPALYWPFISYCMFFAVIILIRLILILGTYVFNVFQNFNKTPKIEHLPKNSFFSPFLLVAFFLLVFQVAFYTLVKSGHDYLIDREKDMRLKKNLEMD